MCWQKSCFLYVDFPPNSLGPDDKKHVLTSFIQTESQHLIYSFIPLLLTQRVLWSMLGTESPVIQSRHFGFSTPPAPPSLAFHLPFTYVHLTAFSQTSKVTVWNRKPRVRLTVLKTTTLFLSGHSGLSAAAQALTTLVNLVYSFNFLLQNQTRPCNYQKGKRFMLHILRQLKFSQVWMKPELCW